MLWTTRLIRRHILSPGVYTAQITVRILYKFQFLAIFSSYSVHSFRVISFVLMPLATVFEALTLKSLPLAQLSLSCTSAGHCTWVFLKHLMLIVSTYELIFPASPTWLRVSQLRKKHYYGIQGRNLDICDSLSLSLPVYSSNDSLIFLKSLFFCNYLSFGVVPKLLTGLISPGPPFRSFSPHCSQSELFKAHISTLVWCEKSSRIWAQLLQTHFSFLLTSDSVS